MFCEILFVFMNYNYVMYFLDQLYHMLVNVVGIYLIQTEQHILENAQLDASAACSKI